MKKLVASLGAMLAALTFSGEGIAKEKVTLMHPTDPAFEASVWPILAGKVKSDKIDFEISFSSIQAVIQAVGTQQYDLLPMVTNVLPRLAARGVPAKIIATNQRYSLKGGGSRLYVAAKSPVKSIEDLKGKTIGITSLSSSGVTATRISMSVLANVNVEFDGGDFKWVEMPLAVMPTALSSGRIDAAVLSNQYDYAAFNDKENYRLILPKGLTDALGVEVPGTVIIGYTPKLEARPEAFVEAARMLKASAEYVHKNQNEVFGAVAKKNNINPEYLKWYYEYYADIPYNLTKADLKGIVAFWGALQKLKMLKDIPDVNKLVWDKVKVE